MGVLENPTLEAIVPRTRGCISPIFIDSLIFKVWCFDFKGIYTPEQESHVKQKASPDTITNTFLSSSNPADDSAPLQLGPNLLPSSSMVTME